MLKQNRFSIRRWFLISLLFFFPENLFSAESDRPFFTEKASEFLGEYLYVTGVATNVDSLERGRELALENAKREIMATMQIPDIRMTEIITERNWDEPLPNGKFNVWRYCKVNVDKLQRGRDYQFPNITQEEAKKDGQRLGPKREHKEYGKLSIVSSPPDASIYLDARLFGRTPLLIQQVLIGERNVTISADGFEDFIVDVTVNRDEMTIVKAGLKQQTGTLQLESTPTDSEVYLDGFRKGNTPITIENIPVGPHKLRRPPAKTGQEQLGFRGARIDRTEVPKWRESDTPKSRS
jgi:hypothetical protein